MRGYRFFLPFFLGVVFFACLGGEARAAARASPSRLDAAVADFSALGKDARKAGLRESWEKLAARFAGLRKGAAPPAAARAAFYEARSLEELARRSRNANDFRKAETALAGMAKTYPKSPLSPEASRRLAALRDDARDDQPERAAAPQGKKTPSRPGDPKAAAALYQAAAEDWRALLRNSQRGNLRDPWLDLERRFLAALDKDPQGSVGAKARFQAARCREELAGRSYLASDWRHAVSQYLALASDFADSDLADDGLFRAAFILAKRLDDPEGARDAAERVLARYPQADMAGSARELIASLPPAPPPQPPAGKRPLPPVAAPAPAGPARLRAINGQGTAKRATVILELDKTADFTHQCLGPTKKGAPARLQIDCSATRPGEDLKPTLTLQDKAVPRVRTALADAGSGREGPRTRVIIDLPKIREYTVAIRLSPPAIIVQASRDADLADGLTPPGTEKKGPLLRGNFSGSAEQARPGSLVEQLGLTVRTIMIDPGHGGRDPGAMGNGIRESALTLRLAKMLGERLRKAGYAILYTREKDVYVPLEQRTEMANKKKADLFISLHVNANPDPAINGLETYFLDLARTSSAATVAARENAVSVKSISDLQFILTDLMLSTKLQESRELSRLLHGSACARAQKAGFSVADNGVKSAPFYVLMGARMPAALVEIGYLSNAADARRLQSEAYLERLADGLAGGVTAYKQKLAKFAAR